MPGQVPAKLAEADFAALWRLISCRFIDHKRQLQHWAVNLLAINLVSPRNKETVMIVSITLFCMLGAEIGDSPSSSANSQHESQESDVLIASSKEAHSCKKIDSIHRLLASKSKGYVRYLIYLLSDPDENVRVVAAWALGQIGNRKAIGPLVRALVKNDAIIMRGDDMYLVQLRKALAKLTGKRLGDDPKKWDEWWKAENVAPRPDAVVMQGPAIDHFYGVCCAAIPANGACLIFGEPYLVSLWDARTNYAKWSRKFPPEQVLTAVAMSPDLRMIACGFETGRIEFLEAATGRLRGRVKSHDERVNCLAFSDDGSQLLSGGKQEVYLHDIFEFTSKKLTTFQEVTSVAFVHKGSDFVSGDRTGSVFYWDVASGKKRYLYQHSLAVNLVVTSSDGKFVASSTCDVFRRGGRALNESYGIEPKDTTPVSLYDIQANRRGRSLGGFDGEVQAMAFDVDGASVAIASGKLVKVWDIAAKKWLLEDKEARNPLAGLRFDATAKQLRCIDNTRYLRSISLNADEGKEPIYPELRVGHGPLRLDIFDKK